MAIRNMLNKTCCEDCEVVLANMDGIQSCLAHLKENMKSLETLNGQLQGQIENYKNFIKRVFEQRADLLTAESQQELLSQQECFRTSVAEIKTQLVLLIRSAVTKVNISAGLFPFQLQQRLKHVILALPARVPPSQTAIVWEYGEQILALLREATQMTQALIYELDACVHCCSPSSSVSQR